MRCLLLLLPPAAAAAGARLSTAVPAGGSGALCGHQGKRCLGLPAIRPTHPTPTLPPLSSWFDLDLSAKPYRALRYHGQPVRGAAFHRSYPLFASSSDDGTAHIFHGMVYSDLMTNPLIVPGACAAAAGCGDAGGARERLG